MNFRVPAGSEKSIMEPPVDVSIVIPVLNEAAHIGACLEGVRTQITSLKTEIIVIDSGSTDGSLALIEKFSGVRLIRQTRDAFGHGRTRNLGVELSRGKWVVFLNGDAVPEDPYWLSALVRPLQRDSGILGVYSRHIPREDCPLYMRRDLLRSMPETPGHQWERWDPTRPMQFSTVSAAVPRSLWEKFPFTDGIDIAEDQEWARRVLNSGGRLVYEPRSRVIHSHRYSFRQMYRLKKRVSRALPRFHHRLTALFGGAFLAVCGGLWRFLGDIPFVIRHAMGPFDGFAQILICLVARKATFMGRYAGWLAAAFKDKDRKSA